MSCLKYIVHPALLQYKALLVAAPSSVCGGDLIAGVDGELSSPNYPSNYGTNITCEWVIRPDSYLNPEAYLSGTAQLFFVELVFQGTIDLEGSEGCIYDRIEVSENSSKQYLQQSRVEAASNCVYNKMKPNGDNLKLSC